MAVRESPTVAQLCDEYVAEMDARHINGKKASTVYTDKSRIRKYIAPRLGKLKVASVTQSQIEDFMNELSPGSAKRIIGLKTPKEVPKEAPQPADVIENDKPRAQGFERKFLKIIREMMEDHKKRNVELFLAANEAQRRKLLKEKLRRLEASIAEREGAKS